eukprot:CAMPEP_0177757202 /NCGR_PEP_ID=MMETSP0491_2-20121128/3517_1 /TAXON_ID=63592 /ORGANISM="Tetraselmis chuii, Strain PLY429" /LENGTH=395 /DNA_ID=CAMNT_0019272837 /DNA_START=409 /DNA_END=1596 /DNA_ORIENTATION=-
MPLSTPRTTASQRLAGPTASTARPALRPRPLTTIVQAANYTGAGGWEVRTQTTVGWQSGHEQAASRVQADYQARWAQAMEQQQRQHKLQTRGSHDDIHSWGGEHAAPSNNVSPHVPSWEYPHHQHSNGIASTHSRPTNPLEDIGGGEGAGMPCSVEFKLCFGTEYGQSLKVIGSTPSLGSWDLAKAPSMSWSEGDMWSTKVALNQCDVVEYKYVLVGSDGHATAWQEGSNNALAIKLNQKKLELTDNWDGGLGSLVVIEGSCDEGKPASREQQLLSRANEIEAMMATTKHQVREWRVELQGAKEEVKVARMEVAHVKSELQMEKQTTKAQALEIKLLKEENFELKTKLTESNAGFKSALETARLLLAEIEESGGTLPPLPESPMPHIPVRNHVQA